MKSMTGYGSCEGKVGKGVIFVEARSVNHRYCDIQLRIPPWLNPIDPELRRLIKSKVERGKVELYMKEKRGVAAVKDLSLDIDLAKKYNRCLKELQERLGLRKKDIHLLDVVDVKELVRVEEKEVDCSRYWKAITDVALRAVSRMDVMRSREGAFLQRDQRKRIRKIGKLLKSIGRISEAAIKKYRQEVGDRFENGSLVDKMGIDEELTRLKSHIKQYLVILGGKGAVGRQLDFLLQEMNREINTLGAKASDAAISNHVVTVKTELEKLREQVQNIE